MCKHAHVPCLKIVGVRGQHVERGEPCLCGLSLWLCARMGAVRNKFGQLTHAFGLGKLSQCVQQHQRLNTDVCRSCLVQLLVASATSRVCKRAQLHACSRVRRHSLQPCPQSPPFPPGTAAASHAALVMRVHSSSQCVAADICLMHSGTVQRPCGAWRKRWQELAAGVGTQCTLAPPPLDRRSCASQRPHLHGDIALHQAV